MTGAEYWDVEDIEGAVASLRLKDGEVLEAREGFSRLFLIRAFHKGSWSYASTERESEVARLLARAQENAVRLARLVPKPYSLGDFVRARGGYKTPVRKNPANLGLAEKLARVKELLASAGRVKTEAGYSDSEERILLKTSEGLEAEQTIVRCGLSLTCIAKRAGDIQRMFVSERGTGGWEIVDSLGSGFAEDCGERARALLDAKAAPSGEMTVIMDPLLVGTFVHEALGHMAEADHIVNHDSVLEGKLGAQIGSPLVTIAEDKTLEGGYGTRGFDRDGAESERTVVIENGVLKNYLHSRNSAGKLGARSTANCWADFNNVRMSNTYALAGGTPFEEILKETKEGIYLVGSSGGTAMTADGYFNFAALEGFLVRNGSLANRVRDVALLGNTLEALRAVDFVGKESRIEAGICGKGGEWVPVGSGGPHFRTRAIVGGTSSAGEGTGR